jgi:cytochrome c
VNMAAVIGLPMAAAVLAAAGLVGAVSLAESATPSTAHGAEVYERCAACHSLEHDRTGPRHCGLFGRRAGSVSSFEYSDAMRKSGIVWDDRTLDRFLAAPTRVVPGTSMGYSGVDDARERRDLVAYLRAASVAPECGRTPRAAP